MATAAAVAAATDQLERLHDELDLADAAGPVSFVLLQLAANDLALDPATSCRAMTRTPKSR